MYSRVTPVQYWHILMLKNCKFLVAKFQKNLQIWLPNQFKCFWKSYFFPKRLVWGWDDFALPGISSRIAYFPQPADIEGHIRNNVGVIGERMALGEELTPEILSKSWKRNKIPGIKKSNGKKMRNHAGRVEDECSHSQSWKIHNVKNEKIEYRKIRELYWMAVVFERTSN